MHNGANEEDSQEVAQGISGAIWWSTGYPGITTGNPD